MRVQEVERAHLRLARRAGVEAAALVAAEAVARAGVDVDLHLGLGDAWDIGMKNYLFGDALKIVIAAGLLPGAWRLVGRRGQVS